MTSRPQSFPARPPLRRESRLAPAVVGLLVVMLAGCGLPAGQGLAEPTAPGGQAITMTPSAAVVTPSPQVTGPATGSPPAAAGLVEATSRVPSPAPTAPSANRPTPTTTKPSIVPGASADPRPSPAPSLAPSPSLDPPPSAGPFAMDLFRKGDFVSQATKDWCTAAALQIMVNIVEDGEGDATRATQRELYVLGRSLPPFDPGPGIPPRAWASALNEAGIGPYVVHQEPTRTLALKAAARAIRLTGRPVGLSTWRGAHAWVMSGFQATADPALTDAFQVTGVWTEDPWYPRLSSIWGRSNRPHTLVTPKKLAEDFLIWRRPNGSYPEYDKTFVVILPVLEGPAT